LGFSFKCFGKKAFLPVYKQNIKRKGNYFLVMETDKQYASLSEFVNSDNPLATKARELAQGPEYKGYMISENMGKALALMAHLGYDHFGTFINSGRVNSELFASDINVGTILSNDSPAEFEIRVYPPDMAEPRIGDLESKIGFMELLKSKGIPFTKYYKQSDYSDVVASMHNRALELLKRADGI
jgi:hypothetical protein